VAPSLTERTPAVRAFSRRWAKALIGSKLVSGTVPELAFELRPLTLRMALAVHAGAPDEGLGRDVGAVLLRQGYGATEVIGPTVRLLGSGLTEEFAAALDGWPAPDVVATRVALLAGAVAEGFAHATREHALVAQEELQRAALASVRTAEAERSSSEARFRALFTHAAVGIGLLDLRGRVIDSNAAWAAMMGIPLEQMRGRPIEQVVSPGGSPAALRRLGQVLAGARDHFRLEIPHVNHAGRRLYLDLSISKVSGAGAPDFVVGVAIDITERKLLEDRLWHESRHDPLTGLPNRTLFFERLDQLLGAEPAEPVGVCYVDLDGFKSINDGLGHDVGDRLLVQVAARLRDAVSPGGGLLARLGGDEFGVLIGGPHDADAGADAAEQAGRVLDALTEPIVIDGRELTVSASVGVVDTATAGTEAGGLMRAADISLYRAKSRGRGRWERHDPQSNARQVTRHALGTEMSAALARGEFFLEYQPLVTLRDGAVRRVEALLRWRHPQLGLLYPDRFVPMAEENGHIVALGRWVLETACRQAVEWHRRFPETGIGMNVNVAVGQLHDPELPDHVRATLAGTGLPPDLLYLELTESAVLGDAHGPLDALSGLTAAGVRLVIDDFGTGYSNLEHLSRLPACELKTAGSFLSPSSGAAANDKILPAVISLAHSLGLTVTAEGVENAAQAERLLALDCDTAQGWYFAPPGPADAVTRLLGGACAG
jgi:diguanylate cyclase (GGDEF)-like protein/PAS domain S-box-containing protein